MTENYKATMTVDAPLKTVFDSINKITDWWGHIEGPTQHQGDEFVYHPGETTVNMKITEMMPDKKIVWHVTDCYLPWLKDIKEWKDTTMVFNLKPVEEGTEIDFEHVGLTPDVECYNGCVKGWDQYIKGSLKDLITNGVGKPGM